MFARVQFLLAFCLLLGAASAHAQREGSNAWLNLDYTYTDMTYKEPLLTEKGHFAGIRGDLGLGLFDNIGISVGGEYKDGNLNFDGTTLNSLRLKQVTRDYIRDTHAMIHFLFGPVVLSGGIGQKEWFNDLVTSYRRRQTYDYYPTALTIYRDNLYIKFEMDVWKGGRNKTYMHDVNAEEKDVDFVQKSGNGYGAEIGYMIPTAAKIFSRVFIAYHQWSVEASDTQFDGTYNLTVTKNSLSEIQGGVGLAF